MEKLSGKAKALLGIWSAGIVLVFLKAANVIEWPWVWVTAPLWGPFAVFYALLLLTALFMLLARALRWISEHL